jgi:hypothetical protein
MTDTRAVSPPTPVARDRRGFRIALLSAAAAILLLGAAVAGDDGYAAIAHVG